MNIMKFFSALLPSFERSRIVEDIDLLRTEVKDVVLPAYKQAASVTHGKKFGAKITQNFNELFVAAMPRYRNAGFVAGTLDFYSSLVDKLDMIDRLVGELFAKDVTKESLTYRKTAILQYLAAVRFANQYSARALLRYLAAEQNVALGREEAIDTQLSPGEKKWLEDNLAGYFQALKLLALPTKDLTSALNAIPEITVVPERYEVTKQTVGADKLDPLRLDLISANYNPIYFIRSLWAEYQVETYKRDKETKRALEFRVLALKQAYEGTQDARIQQQIEYTEGRIAKISAELAEKEARYA